MAADDNVKAEEVRQARMDQIKERLENSGYRITPQRLCIIDALLVADGHPSAEQIFARVRRISPTTSLATIYKTLDMLQELGEVMELNFRGDHSNFDALQPSAHPHVICTNCGKIADVQIDGLANLQLQATHTSGFQIAEQHIEFYGLCHSCQVD